MNGKIGLPLRGLLLAALTVMVSFAGGCEKKEPATGPTGAGSTTGSAPLNVCAVTPDAASLVREVGKNLVDVTCFVKGPDDPHTLEATTAMVQKLSKADLLVSVDLDEDELEHDHHGGLPSMLKAAKNAKITPPADGFLRLDKTVRTLVGPESKGVKGSFHPYDNPHYLTDPVEGVKSAKAIAAKLSQLRPSEAAAFQKNYEAFARQVMDAMIGQELASVVPIDQFEDLCIAIEHGKLADYLKEKKIAAKPLGGWLGKLEPYRESTAVGDHDLWPYFARRYSIRVIGYVEPEPGEQPSAAHMTKLATLMKEKGCKTIMTSSYFDPRHTTMLVKETGAKTAAMAHQPGARPGTDGYVDFVNYNAGQLLGALEPAKP